MRFFIILVLCSVPFCQANNILCQIYNETEQSLQVYCEDFNGTLPENCSDKKPHIDPNKVTHLNVKGCLRDHHSLGESLDWAKSEHNQLEMLNTPPGHYYRDERLHFLEAFPNLTEVDFSHNKLMYMYPVFSKLLKLKKLNLSHNDIDSIRVDLKVLSHLEHLDVSNNQIMDGLLDSIGNLNLNLREVHVENSQIPIIECQYFELPSTSFFMSWKFVESINMHCGEVKLKVILNSGKEGIFPTSAGQYELHCNDQSFLEVREVEIANVQIENPLDLLQCFGSSLQSIGFSNVSIGELNATTFARFSNLEVFRLVESELMQFDLSALKNQKQLQYLFIVNNNLKQLTNIPSLAALESLKILSVDGNHLENVTEILQYLPSSVTSLDLSNNFIGGTLKPNSFSNLNKLTYLDVSNTNLSISDFNPFDELENLVNLRISSNKVDQMNLTVMSKTFNKLVIFSATDCQIKNVSEVIQYLGEDQEYLDLSGNDIREFNFDTFKELTGLRLLELRNANLSNIDLNSSNYKSKNWYMVDLSHNKLRSIDFGPMIGILHLNVEENDLIELKNFSSDTFREYGGLSISKNYLPCEYLRQIVPELETALRGNPWSQKHGDCRSDIKIDA